MTCQFYQGDSLHQPFSFFRQDPGGAVAEVLAKPDPSGLCVFSNATCDMGAFRCCQASPWTSSKRNVATTLNSTFGNLLVFSAIVIVPWICQRLKDRQQRSTEEPAEVVEKPQARSCFQRAWERRYALMTGLGFVVVLVGEIIASIEVAKETQRLLSVPVRNTLMTSAAFLTPVAEVFTFLEEIITVKIINSMGQGAIEDVRGTLKIGVVSGLILGLMAALTVTGIAFWPSLIELLLAPFASLNEAAACSLVPDGPTMVEDARPYVLLQAWSWPFAFVNMSLRGFMLGAGEWDFFLWFSVPQTIVVLVGIFMFFSRSPTLEVLGWISFCGPVLNTIGMGGAMCLNKSLQARYGLCGHRQKAPKPEGAGTSGPPQQKEDFCDVVGGELDNEATEVAAEVKPAVAEMAPVPFSWSQACQEGLCALVVDMSTQLATTGGVYLAGSQLGLGAMYHLATFQNVTVVFGLGQITGFVFLFRIVGTNQIGAGQYESFRGTYRAVGVIVAMLVVVGAVTLLPFAAGVAFDEGAQACVYASSPGCMPVYNDIFGGQASGTSRGTLQDGLPIAFMYQLAIISLYAVVKAGLYACMDWTFMAKVSLLTFVLVTVPALIVATFVVKTSLAIWVAMYSAFAINGVAFLWRMHHNTGKMLRNEPGPWCRSTQPKAVPEPQELQSSA